MIILFDENDRIDCILPDHRMRTAILRQQHVPSLRIAHRPGIEIQNDAVNPEPGFIIKNGEYREKTPQEKFEAKEIGEEQFRETLIDELATRKKIEEIATERKRVVRTLSELSTKELQSMKESV